MRVFLVSGFGPTCKNDGYFKGTLFDGPNPVHVERGYFSSRGNFGLRELSFCHKDAIYPLLRSIGTSVPHLTTFTLASILANAGHEVVHIDTETIWRGNAAVPNVSPEAILLSTSYIWDMKTLRKAVAFCDRCSADAPLFLGGQYANLRYEPILRQLPQVTAIMRGDAEHALPLLLEAVSRAGGLSSVPNLVINEDLGRYRVTDVHEIPFDDFPAPPIEGRFEAVPYESMRGCPFTCGFCSFPFASPHWRYRSAARIAADWSSYAERNGTSLINAMDSTFTVPPRRMDELLELLPPVGVRWEAYSRANYLKDRTIIDRLVEARCRALSIGFESMSDVTLRSMSKKVTAAQNWRAFELLKSGSLGFRCSFMVGYPGETPDNYKTTHDFLVNNFVGHFKLHVFGLTDEAMPVWGERERFDLKVLNDDEPDFSWVHSGMDATTALELNHWTLDAVRRQNSLAVLHMWQDRYQRYLIPSFNRTNNLRIEKLVEKIAMLPRDFPDPSDGLREFDWLLAEASEFGIFRSDPRFHRSLPLVSD